MTIATRIRAFGSTAVAVALAVGGLTLASAPAAHAVPSTSSILITPGCVDGTGDLDGTTVLDDTNTMILTGTITGAPGDVISLVSMCADGVDISTNLGSVVTLSSANSPQSLTLALGMNVLTFSAGIAFGDVTLVVTEAPATPAAGVSQLPPPSIQGLPMPASGKCSDITNDAAYAYGTGLTGGWTTQWGEWANSWVCARTLAYVHGKWTLAA